MGWQDTARLLNGVLAHSPSTFRSQGYQTFEQRFRPRQDVYRTSRPASQRINWSDFATGRLATPKPPTTPAGFPERINVSPPYSSTAPGSPYAPPAAAPMSTEGDLLGSFGAAGGSVLANLNLANVIPYAMERLNVLANDLADARIPVVSDVARPVASATDLFIDGVETVMTPVGQVLDAFPAWVRDSQLKDRAKLYRAIANGETADEVMTVSNPIATLLQLAATTTAPIASNLRAQMGESVNPLAGLTGQTVSEQAWQANRWRNDLLNSIDPDRRLVAEQRLGILRESIDLPESVKLLLERNPRATDDEVARWLDEAPEGKQWSYMPGAPGIFQNMGTSLLFFLAEAKAGYGAMGALKASTLPGVARGAELAGRGISLTAKLQTAAVASGVGITATTTTMNAIARYAGADEAIAWFDKANRSTEFSDDPYVQLATGFSVNPFAAARMAGKGLVPLKHGLVDVPVGKIMGKRLQRFYDSTTVVEDMTRRMFKLGSREEAAVFLDEQGLRETAHDRVLGTALDLVLEKLPKAERLAINGMHADPVERAAAVLKKYGQRALDEIERNPDLVAARFYDYDWQYRMMPGAFQPELAAKIARDHRGAVDMTYDLRAKDNLVVGYREFLPPKAQALARDRVAAADVDGKVPMRVLQELVVDMPALRKEWGGLVKSTDEMIPRAVVDRIIDNAHITWSNAANRNPRKVATGVDPVLRPGSPTLQRDYAEAVGTNIDTIKAIEKADPGNAAQTDLLRRFLVDKGVTDEAAAAALSPEEAWSRAASYLEDTTAPWRAMGDRLEAADVQMTRLRSELVRVKREGGSVEHDRTLRIQREINELADLIRTAGDPIRTFASGAPRTIGLGDSHLAELAARKVDAMDRLRVIASVDEDLAKAELTERDLVRVVLGADGELADVYDVLGAPPTPVLDAYLAFRTANMYVTKNVPGELTTRRQSVRELTNKGQEFVRFTEAAPGSYQWAEIAKSPGFVRRMRELGDKAVTYGETPMTGNQIADIVEAAGLVRGVTGKPIDDIAKAWEVEPSQALTRLAGLRDARAQALDGSGVPAIKRTAGIKVSDDYVAQAEADRAARELVYDAEYDAFWHPRNVAKVVEITGKPDELYAGLRAVVEGDAALEEGIAAVAARAGLTADQVLDDAAHAAAVKAELVPPDFEPPIEGLIREWTDLDYLITAGDAEGIAALSEQIATSRAQPRPPTTVTEKVARSLAQMPKKRRSYNYRRQISDAGGDFKVAPADRILSDAGNKTGLETLSVMNHGITGTRPATVDGVIALLRDIEDGAATRIGIGPELQAEAQRVAREILDDAVRQAKTNPELAGTFGMGTRIFPEDEQALAATLDDLLRYDDANPMGTLQYGLKKAAKDAVVMEWSKVPGLAEELFSKRFQPWEERIAVTKAREAFSWIFGRHSNPTVRQQTRNRFVERAGTYGVSQPTAAAIWDRWMQLAHDSRRPSLKKTKEGIRRYEAGDNPLYADVWNLPNEMLDDAVHGSWKTNQRSVLAELADPRRAEGPISLAEVAAAEKVDWAAVFRESASFTRRTLADRGGSLGQLLADTYGLGAHNRAVTTLYYWFRFGLDARYHAMNYFEAQILYLGRAGLRKGEIDEGLLGMSEGYLRKLDLDPTHNTGYPFSRDRMAWAYRTFLKEQPDALRRGIKTVMKEGPEGQALMERAMRELADSDPQLRDMIEAMGATPEKYLAELDGWHRKMLNNVDEASDALVIDEALAKEMADSPALAELFDRLGQVNRDLWTDIRSTFYGNPNRSRAERFLNSYLLFWPLSYQIKATKWFAKVLFDRAGGLQTNALGAVVFDRMADTHNRLLVTDPEYGEWFEKHDTLVFAAQMFFPVSFDQMGVSLSPPLRAVFFGRDPMKALEIGPVYTVNLLKRIRDEIEVDLYPTISDLQAGGQAPAP